MFRWSGDTIKGVAHVVGTRMKQIVDDLDSIQTHQVLPRLNSTTTQIGTDTTMMQRNNEGLVT